MVLHFVEGLDLALVVVVFVGYSQVVDNLVVVLGNLVQQFVVLGNLVLLVQDNDLHDYFVYLPQFFYLYKN